MHSDKGFSTNDCKAHEYLNTYEEEKTLNLLKIDDLKYLKFRSNL